MEDFFHFLCVSQNVQKAGGRIVRAEPKSRGAYAPPPPLPPGFRHPRVKVSDNLGATAVAPVAPLVTSLSILFVQYNVCFRCPADGGIANILHFLTIQFAFS